MQPFFERDNLSLYCGDLREVLPTLRDEHIPVGLKQTAEKKGSQFIESTIGVVGAGNAAVDQSGGELDLLDAGVTNKVFIREDHMPLRPMASGQKAARRCQHDLPDAKVTDSPTRPHAGESGRANGKSVEGGQVPVSAPLSSASSSKMKNTNKSL